MPTLKDYASETLAIDLKPYHHEEFDRLFKLIKNPAGFRLIVIQFNDPVYRDFLINKVVQLNGKAAVLELTSEKFPTFHSLEEALKDLAKANTLIHLVNLENWLFPEGSKSMVVGFNYQRESMARECPVQLLLWMTGADIKTFAVDAPDMWAWRSAVLDFSVEKAGMVHEPARESGLMEGLPLKSRIKRINEIKEFLANKPEGLSASLSLSLLNELGRLFSSIGKYEVALKHFKESLEIWKETGNRQGEGNALNNIGSIYQSWGKYEEALRCFKESLKICNETKDRLGEGATLNNIGSIYQSWGKYEEALRCFKKSLEICNAIGDRKGEGVLLNNIGLIYEYLGKYEEALKHYKESLVICKETGDRRVEGVTLSNIGLIYEYLDKYEKALRCFKESLEICNAIGDRKGEGNALNNIGGIYDSWGKYEEAMKHFKESLKISKEIGDRRGQGITLGNMGRILMNKDKNAAIAYLEEAVKIDKELKNPNYEKNKKFLGELTKNI